LAGRGVRNRIQVRGQEHALRGTTTRGQGDQHVGAFGNNLLELDLQTGLRALGGEEIGHQAFARARVLGRDQRRVHTGQRNQLAQQFRHFAHAAGGKA
jgi:hypothetical protein